MTRREAKRNERRRARTSRYSDWFSRPYLRRQQKRNTNSSPAAQERRVKSGDCTRRSKTKAEEWKEKRWRKLLRRRFRRASMEKQRILSLVDDSIWVE